LEQLYRGDDLAYESHIIGLRRIVDLKGGLQSLGLDGALQYCVRRVDTLYAMATGTSTYFVPPKNAKVFCGHFGAKQIDSITSGFDELTLASLPPGFALTVPSSSSYFSADFIEMVREICDAASSAPPVSHDQRQWFKINSLLGKLSGQSAPSLSPFGDLQRPLYLALSIFIWKLRPRPAQMHAQTVIAKTLVSAIFETSIAQGILWKGAYGDLFLWIVFIGAMGTSDAPGSETVKEEFIKLWVMVADMHSINTWAEVRSLLQDFLWVDHWNTIGPQLWLEVEDCRLRDGENVKT
jgi:hypothetical protein